MIIDADGCVLGRLATFAAKKALLGQDVIVVNAEKAVITGSRSEILESYVGTLIRKNKQSYLKGPFSQKRPDRFVRRTIRGMLPVTKQHGKDAFKRVMTYAGVPEEQIKKNHKIEKLKIETPSTIKKAAGVTVGEICAFIGGKSS